MKQKGVGFMPVFLQFVHSSNQVLHNEQDCSDLARGLTINYDLNQLIYFDSLSSLCHCINSNYSKFFFCPGYEICATLSLCNVIVMEYSTP